MAERFIGQMIGGIVAVYLFARLLEWAGVGRGDSPEWRVTKTTSIVAIVGFVLYGFGNARGGGFNPFPGGLAYILAAFIVTPMRAWAARRQSSKSGEADSRL